MLTDINMSRFEISSFDVPLPLNLNDKDLSMGTAYPLEEGKQWTDSTLLILSADITQRWRLLYDSRRRSGGATKTFDNMTDAEKRIYLDESSRMFEERYIKICSPLVPIQWVRFFMSTLLAPLVLTNKCRRLRPP